ncbi:Ku protein [Falsigemmobacter intermedius]|uniref:non-homologous end joining protein Ku n=1 Tax=Falsigemmobacter intermedius TaxID=1553448 RepID=UPI003F06F564
MAPRANWKGFLSIADLSCPVALYTAASEAERISFHMINRATGNRLRREFIDSETGKPVSREDQVKGYELSSGHYVELSAEEVAEALPEGDRTLVAEAFLPCAGVDEVYLDRPYYLAPADASGAEAFALIRHGLEKAKVAAIARAVLFRRVRKLLIYPHDRGMIAHTLNFDYEVRPAAMAFKHIAAQKTEPEMLELARHIIAARSGRFDPEGFDDRYEEALQKLILAKAEGRRLKPKRLPKPARVVDLMEALRESAAADRKSRKKPSSKPGSRRRAG